MVNMGIPAVITIGMLMREKTNLVYPKRLKNTKGLRAVFPRCQIKRPLYVSVKQEKLITLPVSWFPNLFVNHN